MSLFKQHFGLDDDSNDMDRVFHSQRVFEELGSLKSLLFCLVDEPTNLLFQIDTEIRLGNSKAMKTPCRIYLFTNVLIIAAANQGSEERDDDDVEINEGGDGKMEEMKDGIGKDLSKPENFSVGKTVEMGARNLLQKWATKTSTITKNSTGKTGKELDFEPVWFSSSGQSFIESDLGFEKQGDNADGISVPSSNSSSMLEEEKIYEALQKKEEMEARMNAKYELKLFAELAHIVPRFYSKRGDLGLFLTFSCINSEVENSDSDKSEIIVDETEIWMENNEDGKLLMGKLQDAINQLNRHLNQSETDSSSSSPQRMSLDLSPVFKSQKTRIRLSNLRKSEARSRSVSNTNARTTEVKSEPPANINHGHASPGKTLRAQIRSKLRKRSSKESQVNTQETAGQNDSVDGNLESEFVVVFKSGKKQKGFDLTDGRSIHVGPFVNKVMQNSLAEIAGITFGDKVVQVNDYKIPNDMKWKDCKKIIQNQNGACRITFVRKLKNEISRQNKILNDSSTLLKLKESNDNDKKGSTDKNMSDFESGIESDLEEIEIKKRTMKSQKGDSIANSMVENPISEEVKTGTSKLVLKDLGEKEQEPKVKRHEYVIEKNKRRRFAQKKDSFAKIRTTMVNPTDYANFKKNKEFLLTVNSNIDRLFTKLLSPGYMNNDKEKTCVYALREIYQTESKYLQELGSLHEFKRTVGRYKKHILCKDLHNGKPFCEHRNITKLCRQESKFRLNAVDPKDLDQIFLNIKSLVSINTKILTSLQESLSVLFDRAHDDSAPKVQVADLLNAYCPVFIKIAPFLGLYTQYCQRYSQALEKEKELRSINPHFKEIVDSLEKKYRISLPGLLIKPIQRLTKYPLLFETLKKYVSSYILEMEQTVKANRKSSASSIITENSNENNTTANTSTTGPLADSKKRGVKSRNNSILTGIRRVSSMSRNRLKNMNLPLSKNNVKTVIKTKMGTLGKKKKGPTLEVEQLVSQLNNACEKVGEVVNKVNVKVGEAGNLQKMIEAFYEIGGKRSEYLQAEATGEVPLNKVFDLMQPWRRFISKMEGIQFEHLSDPEQDCNECSLYVFNDLLVLAQKIETASKKSSRPGRSRQNSRMSVRSRYSIEKGSVAANLESKSMNSPQSQGINTAEEIRERIQKKKTLGLSAMNLSTAKMNLKSSIGKLKHMTMKSSLSMNLGESEPPVDMEIEQGASQTMKSATDKLAPSKTQEKKRSSFTKSTNSGENVTDLQLRKKKSFKQSVRDSVKKMTNKSGSNTVAGSQSAGSVRKKFDYDVIYEMKLKGIKSIKLIEGKGDITEIKRLGLEFYYDHKLQAEDVEHPNPKQNSGNDLNNVVIWFSQAEACNEVNQIIKDMQIEWERRKDMLDKARKELHLPKPRTKKFFKKREARPKFNEKGKEKLGQMNLNVLNL